MALDAATERDACLLPPDVLIANWPRVDLPADEAGRFLSWPSPARGRWRMPTRCACTDPTKAPSWVPPISVRAS